MAKLCERISPFVVEGENPHFPQDKNNIHTQSKDKLEVTFEQDAWVCCGQEKDYDLLTF